MSTYFDAGIWYNLVENKMESIHAQGANCPHAYSLHIIYQILHRRIRASALCMSIYVSVFFLFVAFCGFVGGKGREKTFNNEKRQSFFEDIFQKGLAFRENVVILQAVGRGHGMKNELIIKT